MLSTTMTVFFIPILAGAVSTWNHRVAIDCAYGVALMIAVAVGVDASRSSPSAQTSRIRAIRSNAFAGATP